MHARTLALWLCVSTSGACTSGPSKSNGDGAPPTATTGQRVADLPATLTSLEVTSLPRGDGSPVDWTVQLVDRGDARIRALVTPTPSTLSVPVVVPADARLDLALGPSQDGNPLTYTIRSGGQVLLDAQVTDEKWTQRTIDLSEFAGQSLTLTLSAEAERPGAVARWGAPTLTAAPEAEHPNVILYVIDGGGADYMSLYGYERDTTPNLTKLAAEGTVFELAHTTSGWTKPSTASFLSSLHHSVLGGYAKNGDTIPKDAHPLAERAHDAGYQTATFTSNPFAGSLSGLERGVDFFRDRQAKENSASSTELHEQFWSWRDDWPGEPYFVHFQTTDVHEPHLPVSPFAGTWVSPERRADFEGWWRDLHATPIEHDTVLGKYQRRLDAMGVDRRAFFETQRDLYDETMAHNDHQLGLFVDELKRRGEWERTLLIVTADHGHPAGSFSRFGRGLIEPQPDDWEGALADSYRSHVPLLVIWPGHLPAGQRIAERVSLIDLLPTVLDLASLPPAEVRQGTSLGPALRGEPWTPRLVVLDQLQAHAPTGEMVGHIEVIDGRWAASMEVMPEVLQADYQAKGESLVTAGGWRASRPHRPSTPRVLLYDIDQDPLCLRNVNAQHPEELAHYTAWLEMRWAAHQDLARLFPTEDGVEGGAEVNPEQMEALRLLGYVD
jgi:arylsulfatase A-like enzyme